MGIKKNEIIMPWEKAMNEAIHEMVSKEINYQRQHYYPQRPGCESTDLMWIWKENKRTKEEETKFRLAHILDVLKQCGVDIEEFKKSFMFNNNRTALLLAHVQGTIDGYEYISSKKRKLKGEPADLSKTQISFENETLTIVIDGKKYVYTMDEHCLIYLNGRVVITKKPVPTQAESTRAWNEDIARMMEDNHADRMAHDRRMERSMEHARHFRVEE